MSRVIARLLERLEALGMSQAEFARAIDESPQTIQNWKARGAIPANKLPLVARTLKTTVDWLLTGVEKEVLGVREKQFPYGGVPKELIDAWQHLDDATRAHLLALIEQIAKVKR